MKHKYNIILDLDNTLLSAVPLEDFSWDKKTKEKALKRLIKKQKKKKENIL